MVETEKPDEKETAEATETEKPAEDTKQGDKPEELSIIERASSEREKLEATLSELKTENDRKEKLLAEEKLGGVSGAPLPVETPKEIDNKSYAQQALEGTIQSSDEGKK